MHQPHNYKTCKHNHILLRVVQSAIILFIRTGILYLRKRESIAPSSCFLYTSISILSIRSFTKWITLANWDGSLQRYYYEIVCKMKCTRQKMLALSWQTRI